VWIHDFLNLSKNFYKQMRLFYEGLNDTNDTERIEMLLEAIRSHVGYLEKELRTVEKETPPEVLDTWFQFTPDPPELSTNLTEWIRPRMTINDMLGMTINFDSALEEFYQRVAESTEFKDVRALFLNLKRSVAEE
jgi:hypothetical protein